MKRPLLHLSLLSGAVGILVLASADTAEAHVCMDFPVSRVGPDCQRNAPQKVGPCGIEGRSEHVNVFRPGETITIEFRKTINHPGHHRVSFNPDGDEFYDPQAIDDISDDNPWVLVDGIFDDAIDQTVEITFPDIECDNCTLQLIQVMYDKQDNGFGGRDADGGNDDLYYTCADIVLEGPSVSEERTFELRTYYTHPGRLDALIQRFEDHTRRIFERHGMENVGYWFPEADGPDGENTLVYLLAHPSREAGEAAWEAFSADPEWREVRAASMEDGDIVERVERLWLRPTEFSKMK